MSTWVCFGLSIMEEGNSNFIDISMGGGRVGRGQSAESEWDHLSRGGGEAIPTDRGETSSAP